MSVIITDLGNDIQFAFTKNTGQDVYTLNKLSLRVKQDENWVYMTNADGFIQTLDNKVIKLNYADVTTPAGLTSNDELFTYITGAIASVSLGGGGASAGGGASVWSTKQGDFTATITDSTKNITIAGLPWTLQAENVAIVELIDSVGDKSTVPLTSVVVSGGVITLADADDFSTGDTVSVTLIGPDKAYFQSIDSQSSFVVNQDSDKWTSPEHLVDLAADATTVRYVVPMEGFKDLSAHWKFTAGGTVVMTLLGTNNADADDSADTDWVDITADYLTKTLSGTTEQVEVAENLFFLKVAFKIVTTGTTNLADVYIKKKAL